MGDREVRDLFEALTAVISGEAIVPLYHIDIGMNALGQLGIRGRTTKAGKLMPEEVRKELMHLVDIGMAGFVKALKDSGEVEAAETVQGGPAIKAEDFREKEEGKDATDQAASASPAV